MDNHLFLGEVKPESWQSHWSDRFWPDIDIRTACDVHLQRLADFPQVLQILHDPDRAGGPVSLCQKIVYLDRKGYLTSTRQTCDSWLLTVNFRSPFMPNEVSILCQNILDTIEDQLQSLGLWLQQQSEQDQEQLADNKQPDQQQSTSSEDLPEPSLDGRLEYLRQRYMQHREEIIDPKMAEELKDVPDGWQY